MRVVILVMLLGCGGPARPPAPVENKSAPAPAPVEVPAKKDALTSFKTNTRPQAATNGQGSVAGTLTNTVGEPLIGATVVFEGDKLVGERVQISDEHGKFTLDAFPPGHYRVTVYYNDQYIRRSFDLESDRVSELTFAGWDESFKQEYNE